MTREKVLDYLSQNKDYIKGKYGITKIGLLGGYARGEEKNRSDIDIIIEIEKSKKNIHTFFAFKRELEAEFGKNIDIRNLLIHEYFGVDLEMVWNIIVEDLPGLRAPVEELLNAIDV